MTAVENTRLVIAIATMTVAHAAGRAVAEEPREFAEFSLDELLTTGLEVTTKKATALRDSPGIVTIVTRDEILRAGARDLLDVLNLVPGFQSGIDTWNEVSVGVRGNWGFEGKVLVLLDGIELNEVLYSTIELGGRIPVEQIDHLEIIRGPGSVVYGDFAELAVIKIVTRSGADVAGIRATGAYGQTRGGYSTRGGGLSAGAQQGDLDFVAHLSWRQSLRGRRLYTDVYGDSMRLGDENARLSTLNGNMGLTYHDLKLRLLAEEYDNRMADGFDAILEEPVTARSRTLAGDASYDWRPVAALTITPRLTYKRFAPWRVTEPKPYVYDEALYYDTKADRTSASLTASYDVREGTTLMMGGEYSLDRAMITTETPADFYPEHSARGELSWGYWRAAAFGQVLAETPYVNVSAGARYDHHETAGSAFVPRVGLTKVFGNLHAKALFAQAFRAPGIENINLAESIRPEKTTVYELELGYRISEALFASINVFDVRVDEPITYFYDEVNDAEGYENQDQSGTSGLELELRFQRPQVQAIATYSYYETRSFLVGERQVSEAQAYYSVPGHPNSMLGLAPHKVTLNAGYELLPKIWANVSGMFLSRRYGYDAVDADDELVLASFDPVYWVNLMLTANDVFIDGLSVTAGMHDLVGKRIDYIQPYTDYHAPMPWIGRDLFVRVSYASHF